jgi:hypothetical protein
MKGVYHVPGLKKPKGECLASGGQNQLLHQLAIDTKPPRERSEGPFILRDESASVQARQLNEASIHQTALRD